MRQKPRDFFNQLNFNPNWIIYGADEAMIVFADKVGKYMAPENKYDSHCLTNSQIRNVYGEVKRIQFIKFSEAKPLFLLLKPKVAYAEGRKPTYGITLFKLIFNKMWDATVNNWSEQVYSNFCALLEAVIAYHKAYGGK